MMAYEWGYLNGNRAENKQAEGNTTLNLIAMKTGAVYQMMIGVVGVVTMMLMIV